ncbi:hypothetical protein UK15_38640 [Streptomyces variegatus]|uniref:Uncharacterized protein n=1 Tax=Streptomyces variegatus TaxID=284040 RepID=A0A0M2GBX1_9ACTN|nr:hypothetical protein UK15_38640 [Streptomyces variegatus]
MPRGRGRGVRRGAGRGRPGRRRGGRSGGRGGGRRGFSCRPTGWPWRPCGFRRAEGFAQGAPGGEGGDLADPARNPARSGRSHCAARRGPTPASTRAVPASTSMSRIRFMYREKSRTTPGPTALPAMLVPPPRAVTGTPAFTAGPQHRDHVVGGAREGHRPRRHTVVRGVIGVRAGGPRAGLHPQTGRQLGETGDQGCEGGSPRSTAHALSVCPTPT